MSSLKPPAGAIAWRIVRADRAGSRWRDLPARHVKASDGRGARIEFAFGTSRPDAGALEAAARSLRSIAEQAGRVPGMEDIEAVRGYANSRATVAEAALAQSQPRECPSRHLCDCIGACKYGLAGSGAQPKEPGRE